MLFNGSVGISSRRIVSLVVELLTLAETDAHLDVRALEVERERHESVSLTRDESCELHYLALVHQQLALTSRLAVEDIALFVGTYVHTDNEKLAVFDRAVGIFEIYRTHTDAFDLCAEKSDTCLVLFVNEVIVIGFFVLRDYLSRLLFVLSHGQVLLSWFRVSIL